MPAPSSCCCSGVSVEVINVPGVEGEAGSYAFSEITDPGFVTPAKGGVAAPIPMDDTGWISVGQFIFIEGSGVYEVDAINSEFSINATYLDIDANVDTTPAIAAGAKVSPSGPPPTQTIFCTNDASPVGVITAKAPAIWYRATDVQNRWAHTNLIAEDNTSWVQYNS